MKKILLLIIVTVMIVTGYTVYRNNAIKPVVTDLGLITTTPPESKPTVTGPLGSYTLKIPKGFTVEPEGPWSNLLIPENGSTGAGPTEFFYISVVPKGDDPETGTVYNYDRTDTDLLLKLKIGQTTVTGGGSDTRLIPYFTYLRSEDAMAGGYGTKTYINNKPWEFPAGTTEYRYIVETLPAKYIFGGYLGSESQNHNLISREQFDAIIQGLTLTPDAVVIDATPVPDDMFITYRNSEYGLSFRYPKDWEQVTGGQSFESGDMVGVIKIGDTQRPQTEMHDGAVFSVMSPITVSESLKDWVQNHHSAYNPVSDVRPVMSTSVIGGESYYTVLDCGLGCSTYYYRIHGGMLFGFMSMTEGPQKQAYQDIIEQILRSVSIKP